ncbi:FecR family protein [Flavihumibacter profundi]|uniref:FecR family protein n=1 Tax=Flavihumibacter profundi TaxID=2716883 RepID=UPI001CC4FB2D|nr:FecR domain-containing protein [Flavihumibacter profundi]MBZ5857803.1 DUF4974 domain-containing protein [Flavihumibacter profundi]
MTQDRIWELLAKKLAGEATVHELEELEEMLRESPGMHYPFQTISDLWFHHPVQSEDAFAAYEKHIARMKELGVNLDADQEAEPEEIYPSEGSRSRKFLWLSLALVLITGAIYYWYPSGVKPAIAKESLSSQGNEVSTRNGSKSKITLPDGSQVWLNSGSKLTYSKEFGSVLREVTLTGEAFFDVVKNPAKPFLIHARNINIRVVGTAFNVKSYPGDKTTETSLIRGIIEVRINNRPKEKIILKPNEKLVVAVDDKPLEKTLKPRLAAVHKTPQVVIDSISYMPVDSTVIETSWMEGKLIFRDESFQELALKMERWYGVTFQFSDNRLDQLRFTGVFQDETLQQALRALKITAPFSYKIDKGKVIISP